tara:strand:- start:65 stop:1453 length:1389 start_codon:yes stop_codon:yes gene_type:complete
MLLSKPSIVNYCFLINAAIFVPLSILSPTALWIPIVFFAFVLFSINKKFIFRNMNKAEILTIVFLLYSIITLFWSQNIEYGVNNFFGIILLFLAYRVYAINIDSFSKKRMFLKVFTLSFFCTVALLFIDIYFHLGFKPWLSKIFDYYINNKKENVEFLNLFNFMKIYKAGTFSGAYNRGLAVIGIATSLIILINKKNKLLLYSNILLTIFVISLGENSTAKFAMFFSLAFLVVMTGFKINLIALFRIVAVFYFLAAPWLLNIIDPINWSEKKSDITEKIYENNKKNQELASQDIFFSKKQLGLYINNYYLMFQDKILHRSVIWSYCASVIKESKFLGEGLYSSRIIGSKENIVLIEKDIINNKINKEVFKKIPLHPHNNTLQIWLELGFIGIFLYCGIFYSLLSTINTKLKLNIQMRSTIFTTFTFVFFINQSSYGLWQIWWLSALVFFIITCTLVTKIEKL